MNAPLGKKIDFDFEENLVEETIPSDRIVWDHWTANRNTIGMNAMSQATSCDKIQLYNGRRKPPKKRT